MAKFPKSKNGARKRAEHAEALADQVEALTAPRLRAVTMETARLSGEVIAALHVNEPYMVTASGAITSLKGRFLKGPPVDDIFRPHHLYTAIEHVETVFPDWGWDLIRWPKDLTIIEGADGGFIHDAEITPHGSVMGRDLIGQHKIMTCALWAAALRARAFQIRVEAGILEPLVNPMPAPAAPAEG